MKKLRIAVDCDDVIVPTAHLILDHYNRTYRTSIDIKDFYSTDLAVWEAPDDATAAARVDKYLMSEEYQLTEPFKEALDVLKRLAGNHELHVVTGRSDFLSDATYHMLTSYFPEVFASVEFTNFYGQKSRSKSDVCQQLNIDVLIDDHPHHASVVAACDIQVLLFGDYPWNSHVIPSGTIERTLTWQDVENKIKLLADDTV